MRGKLHALVPRYPDLSDVGRAIVITNSERNAAACPLRHWYRYVLGLDLPPREVTAAGFGTGFHSVMETLFQNAKETESVPEWAVASEAIEKVVAEWGDLISDSYNPQQYAEDAARLRGVVDAWWRRFNIGRFLDEFEIVDVERAFVAPIRNPATGATLRASMKIVEDEDDSGRFLRLARPGEQDWRRVQWPWLFAGRIDLVVANRRTGVLWLLDHKTTTRTAGLASTLSVDPQAPSYAWLVEQQTGSRVAGFMWNIVDSSAPGEPRILKSGKLSVASNQKVPSWKVREWLEARERDGGVEPSESEREFVEQQERAVDPRWCQIEQHGIGREEVAIAGVEIHATALRLAELYRNGLTDDRTALATTHPRVPVCRAAGAFCSYRGPCSADGPLARSAFETRPSRSWHRINPTTSPGEGSEAPAGVTPAPTNTNGDLGW